MQSAETCTFWLNMPHTRACGMGMLCYGGCGIVPYQRLTIPPWTSSWTWQNTTNLSTKKRNGNFLLTCIAVCHGTALPTKWFRASPPLNRRHLPHLGDRCYQVLLLERCKIFSHLVRSWRCWKHKHLFLLAESILASEHYLHRHGRNRVFQVSRHRRNL